MKEALEIISGVFSGITHNSYIRKNNNEMDKILKERTPDYNEIFTLYKNRFLYVQLRTLHKKSKLSLFLNIMFCTNYLKQEFPNLCNEEISNKIKFIKQQVNYKVEKHDLIILYKSEHYHVVDRDKDITFIDDGGFANIYKCTKLDLAIKRLKIHFF